MLNNLKCVIFLKHDLRRHSVQRSLQRFCQTNTKNHTRIKHASYWGSKTRKNKTKQTHTHTHTIECLVPSLAMSFYWVNRWIHMPKTGNTEIVAGIARHNSVMKTTVTESWQNARTLWVITLPRYLGAFLPTACAISTKPHLAYYIYIYIKD